MSAAVPLLGPPRPRAPSDESMAGAADRSMDRAAQQFTSAPMMYAPPVGGSAPPPPEMVAGAVRSASGSVSSSTEPFGSGGAQPPSAFGTAEIGRCRAGSSTAVSTMPSLSALPPGPLPVAIGPDVGPAAVEREDSRRFGTAPMPFDGSSLVGSQAGRFVSAPIIPPQALFITIGELSRGLSSPESEEGQAMSTAHQLKDGSIFLGPLGANGLPEGKGTLIYPESDRKAKYVGACKAGVPDGSGRMDFKDGSFYVGPFQKGEFHGKGIHVTKEWGYHGNFDSGYKHGEGELHFTSGDIYKGTWKNGSQDYGIFTAADGQQTAIKGGRRSTVQAATPLKNDDGGCCGSDCSVM